MIGLGTAIPATTQAQVHAMFLSSFSVFLFFCGAQKILHDFDKIIRCSLRMTRHKSVAKGRKADEISLEKEIVRFRLIKI